MSTADVARDMDVLRERVGDDQLTYLGFSYGSMLGQIYANLFPDRVRAVVIDGVLDPIAWSTGRGHESLTTPVTERLRSAVGARKTLGQFFQQCDLAAGRLRVLRELEGSVRCARSPAARGAVRASRRTVHVRRPDRHEPRRDVRTAGLARSSRSSWSSSRTPGHPKRSRPRWTPCATASPRLAGGDYPNFVEGFPSVLCSDSVNPPNYRSWPQAADRIERKQGRFGRLWLWYSGVCQPWVESAGQDRYLGPWTETTNSPVLVVGNYYDPATPYHGALIADDLLPRSTLLTYSGWGHTAFALGNTCIDRSVTRYLVTEQPPTEGTVCEPEETPFGVPDPDRRRPPRRDRRLRRQPVPASVRRLSPTTDHRWVRCERSESRNRGLEVRASEPRNQRRRSVPAGHAGERRGEALLLVGEVLEQVAAQRVERGDDVRTGVVGRRRAVRRRSRRRRAGPTRGGGRPRAGPTTGPIAGFAARTRGSIAASSSPWWPWTNRSRQSSSPGASAARSRR